MISYKYPKTINSRYVELYGKQIENLDIKPVEKINYNYDKIRETIRTSNPSEQASLERSKALSKYVTTNKRLAAREPGRDHIGKSTKIPDRNVELPSGCFFSNTSYTNNFMGTDGPVKPSAIRP